MKKNYPVYRQRYFFDPFIGLFDDDYLPEEVPQMKALEMKTDISEKDDHYELDVDLPGIKKENIKIHLKDGYLTIKVHHEDKEDENNKKVLHRERFQGSAQRTYYVGDVDEKKVTANFSNGVLILNLPKKLQEEKEGSHEIAIQ